MEVSRLPAALAYKLIRRGMYVLVGKPRLLGVSATHRPSVRADPQGMQPG
jgi:hypothetical protein